MMKPEIFYLFAQCIIYIILFTLIYKNKQLIKRRYSFHYNSQAKARIKYLKEKQKETELRLEALEKIQNKK